jgi:hypothetical protein
VIIDHLELCKVEGCVEGSCAGDSPTEAIASREENPGSAGMVDVGLSIGDCDANVGRCFVRGAVSAGASVERDGGGSASGVADIPTTEMDSLVRGRRNKGGCGERAGDAGVGDGSVASDLDGLRVCGCGTEQSEKREKRCKKKFLHHRSRLKIIVSL